jgi:hypothetical protein
VAKPTNDPIIAVLLFKNPLPNIKRISIVNRAITAQIDINIIDVAIQKITKLHINIMPPIVSIS